MLHRLRIRIPLRYVLMLLTATGLLPLALLGTWSIHTVSQYQQREQERLMLDLARALSSAADAELDGVVSTLQNLGRSPALQQGDLRGFYRAATAVTQAQPDWLGVILSDQRGAVLFRTMDAYEQPSAAVVDPASLRAALATRAPVAGHIARGQRGRAAFPVRVTVTTADGTLYVLSAVILPDRLMRLIDRQQVPRGAITTIRDGARAVVARSRNQHSTLGMPPSPTLVALMRSAGPEGVGAARTSEGQDMTTAYTTQSRYGWAVVVGRPAEQLYAARLQSLGVYGIGVALSLLAAVVLASLLSRRLVRTIGALQHSATALGAGAPLALAPSSITEVAVIGRELMLAARQRAAYERERDQLLESLNQALASHQAALAEARAAGRAKDEFLAVLGHELRNPLSPIVTSLDLLDRRDDPASRQQRTIMRRQVQHLRRLVDDLLDVSRITSGKFELDMRPVNLAEVVRQAVATAPGTRLSLSAPAALWVLGDDSRLTQVLSNLLSNAARFGSTTTQVTLMAEQGQAWLQVRDNGIGMSQELLARVFEPFQQAPQSLARRSGGLGLGLAIVRKIVEAHGGQVTASSAGSGQGSSFEVVLPLAEAPAVTAPAPASAGAASREVLLVDDNVDAAATCSALLALLGHRVRVAHSSAQALALLWQQVPDVAILDIGLPDQDGYALARAMRQAADGRPLRLVALTGYGRQDDVELAREAGFDLHLTKPATLAELERALAATPEVQQ